MTDTTVAVEALPRDFGRISRCLARAFDEGQEDESSRVFARIATAVAKYWVNKRVTGHVCEALEIAPEEAVFLDDIGRNLKTARTLGMHTIKVEDPELALAELSRVVGVTFDER